jgi:tartrate-resistant acid phosphatase type 5
MYDHPALQNIKWVNVMGNHDYGGSMFICGEYDNQFYECSSKADLLRQLEAKFTGQATYVSPNGDRWKMPARYYVETIVDPASGVSVDIFNVDTNAATVHGGEQICCQCYGYLSKYGGNVQCNSVHRGHSHCAGGDNDLFDACLNKIKEWQSDSLTQLARDAKASTATWKVVNSHYSPHFHMEPPMMQQWFDVLAGTGVHVFINGHTHAESHEWATFNTHFVTNGAGGGIQSESIGSPPPYVTDVSTVWIGANAPYGIFEMSFAKQQMRLRFMTFDDNWVFAKDRRQTVKGGAKVGHCWLIPIDGSKGAEC